MASLIDLHCHILPGVDDGADTPRTSLRMAELAARSEIGCIVATPHCNTRSLRKNYRSAALREAFAALQYAMDAAHIPVELLPGSEVLLRGDVEALLKTQPLFSLADSRYLLVEFYFDETPKFMDAALKAVQEHGYVPMIAHPERYFCVQDMPEIARRWHRLGYGLQLNKGSILGDLGEGAYDCARAFLRDGLCHVIASDAHHCDYRTPSFLRLLEELDLCFPQLPAELFLAENPRRVIENKQLLEP